MSEVDSSILIDQYVGLDFCRTHISECDLTRRVLRELNEFGVNIVIRKSCWERVTNGLANIQMLLEHLCNRASELLQDLSDEDALNEFVSDTLTHSELVDDLNIDPEYLPDVGNLKSDVRDLGIREFRRYLSNNLTQSIKAQRELDLLVSSRYTSSAHDPLIFETSISQIIEDEEVIEILLDAYAWSGGDKKYLLTPQNGVIYREKSDIEDKMNNSSYEILSPEDIMNTVS
ncbi:hypothetical protein ACFPM1_07100 [Halorubrum rubrum]|uniref:Uncharacterized protein n=1 Tax=Halorubrum rubrum TaxID=1126240 RepID=A0ABD5R0Z9_9EURY|nr:hypothetical protein [Halorubrum rubrum]